MFADTYGPWALVAGASDGVGAALAEGLAERGVNVVLLARRKSLLDEVAEGIENRHGVQTRTLAIDLAAEIATSQITAATGDLEIGFLAYCAGADPDYEPFLSSPLMSAEAMVQRNCVVPMRLCHHFAGPMVARGRGGIVLFGSGAGFAGAPNMAAYGASKAFDMVFAEALWAELHDTGVDVIGLILGKTDTPALRTLERKRGVLPSTQARPADSATPEEVVAEAFANLDNGPTVLVGDVMKTAAQVLGTLTRRQAVELLTAAGSATMG